MHFPLLSLLFAGTVSTFVPRHAKITIYFPFDAVAYHPGNPVGGRTGAPFRYAEADTSQPRNVGINTLFPLRPLHVVGSSLFENRQNDSTYSVVSLLKSYNGNVNIGRGKITGALQFQDGVASIAGITADTGNDGRPTVHLTFNTTDRAGVFGERF